MTYLTYPFEAKLAADGPAGAFEGYASVFGTVHASGDMVVPGAFTATLAKHKVSGRMPTMYAMHSWKRGGDVLPVGVWRDVSEDDRGLKVAGQIAAMETDYGRRIYDLVKQGALPRLSIAYRISSGGVTYGTKAGEPKRTLKALELYEISLVDDGDDPGAQIHGIKSSIDSLHEFAVRLRDGEPPQIKEFEDILREAGIPKSMAVTIASRGYAHAIRSESEGTKSAAEAIAAFAARLGG